MKIVHLITHSIKKLGGKVVIFSDSINDTYHGLDYLFFVYVKIAQGLRFGQDMETINNVDQFVSLSAVICVNKPGLISSIKYLLS